MTLSCDRWITLKGINSLCDCYYFRVNLLNYLNLFIDLSIDRTYQYSFCIACRNTSSQTAKLA